jgi:hypothetical protein
MVYKYRLHLYDGKLTPWFPGEDLTQMVKKWEGRIVAIAKEENENIEANSSS